MTKDKQLPPDSPGRQDIDIEKARDMLESLPPPTPEITTYLANITDLTNGLAAAARKGA